MPVLFALVRALEFASVCSPGFGCSSGGNTTGHNRPTIVVRKTYSEVAVAPNGGDGARATPPHERF